jgi:UDP-N-acetylglucosamine acyltransferase
MNIHSTAVIHSSAELLPDVAVGPYCVIGPQVRIGSRTRLESHVCIDANTTVGEECQIRQGAVLGGPPQDRNFRGERSYLTIGDRNIIREFVTIHRASGEEQSTQVGDDNMIMAYCHIGHNTVLGSRIVMANGVGISGHCVVEDRVVFGGIGGLHQFVRVGRLAMIGGMSKVVMDVPPFMLVDGRPAEVTGLNVLGLRRAGAPPRVRAGLRQVFRLLYRSGLNLTQGIAAAYNEVEASEERDYLLEFLTNIRGGHAGRQNERRSS